MGRTGYSSKENVNNIDENHLHFGLQIIFDESQKDGVNQIWIDFYSLSKFLEKNKASVKRIEGTKDFQRIYEFDETPNFKPENNIEAPDETTDPIPSAALIGGFF